MDQPVPHPDPSGVSLQGPHLRLHSENTLPPRFIPMRLILIQTGAVVDVDRPDVIVGRHTDADIRLPLPDVSRRHCRLVYLEEGWQVIDLNSLNGVEVNGEQVLQAPLEQDDQIRIGGFRFLVQITPSTATTPTPAFDSTGHVQSILQTLDYPRRQAS